MEKVADEQLKKEMVFHLYGRFVFIERIINENRTGTERLRILDVGGRGNLLKKFFPNDEVFYLDPFLESDDANFIKGDGCAMPLGDASFDWVVSTDVFEHIPPEKRERFLDENLRVAKRGVVLVAPFYTPEVAQAEINVNKNYQTLHGGEEHMWLKEHIENGLPDTEIFERQLQSRSLTFQKLHNNRLFLWQLLLSVEFLVDENRDGSLEEVFEDFNFFYNTEVAPYDNQEPSYRKIYFLKKDPELKDILVNEAKLDDLTFLRAIQKSSDVMGAIYAKVRSEKELLAREKSVFDQEFYQLNRQFAQADQELRFIKSSKIWFLFELYSKIKSLVSGRSSLPKDESRKKA